MGRFNIATGKIPQEEPIEVVEASDYPKEKGISKKNTEMMDAIRTMINTSGMESLARHLIETYESSNVTSNQLLCIIGPGGAQIQIPLRDLRVRTRPTNNYTNSCEIIIELPRNQAEIIISDILHTTQRNVMQGI